LKPNRRFHDVADTPIFSSKAPAWPIPPWPPGGVGGGCPASRPERGARRETKQKEHRYRIPKRFSTARVEIIKSSRDLRDRQNFTLCMLYNFFTNTDKTVIKTRYTMDNERVLIATLSRNLILIACHFGAFQALVRYMICNFWQKTQKRGRSEV